MATVLLGGTQLEPKTPKIPLTKPLLYAIASLYIYAMHFVMSNPGGSGLALSFNDTSWIAISLVLGIGLYQLANNQVIRVSKLTLGLFIACVLMTIPVFYHNAAPEFTAMRLTGLWAGFVFFLLLQQFRFSNREKQRLLWFIVIGTLIEAILGLYMYFILAPEIMERFDRFTRPFGVFHQPNVMASFLATGLLVAGYLLARQPKKYDQHWLHTALLYITSLTSAFLLTVLASRTGWLGSTLGVLCLLPYLKRYASRPRFVVWLVAIIAGVSIALFSMQQQGISGFVANKVDLQSPRRYTFPQTLDMIIEKPFTGYGYGRFESQYILYTARQHQLNPSYPPGLPAMDHPHNELMYWGVEGGLVPVFGLILAASFVLIRLRYAKKGTRLALLALLIPITLHTQLEYPFYHSAVHWITFLILLYWIEQRSSSHWSFSFHAWIARSLRILSLLIPLVVSFFMLTTLQTNYVLTKFERDPIHNPDMIHQVTNLSVWKDRYDWDIYSLYLRKGLKTKQPEDIMPFVNWAQTIIKHTPRPIFYKKLILSYEALGDTSRAEQTRHEAQFLFPNIDFTDLTQDDTSGALSSSTLTHFDKKD
ncbi:MAG: PglL family O-oligosaccharyltransferase [Vibrio sp.]